MPDDVTYWRVGFHADPYSFKPRDLRSWDHRYDDIDRAFGSNYCAAESITALREVLQELRPNAAALDEYRALFGTDDELPLFHVTWCWRRENVLAAVTVSAAESDFSDLGTPFGRATIERKYASLLHEHGHHHLDVTDATTRDRNFTQSLARALFDAGHAGVRFRSNLDGAPCLALFEDRAELLPHPAHGEPTPLTEDHQDLLAVCGEWSLALEPDPS